MYGVLEFIATGENDLLATIAVLVNFGGGWNTVGYITNELTRELNLLTMVISK